MKPVPPKINVRAAVFMEARLQCGARYSPVSCRGEFSRAHPVTAAMSSRSASARPRIATAVSLIGLAVSLRVEGKTEVLPCRPTIACTAQIEAPGVLVLEAGYLRKDLAGGTQHSVPFLLKLSLDERLQLQLGSNGPTFADGSIPQRFHDDLTLGAKLRLLHTDETALSVSATASLPIPVRRRAMRKRTTCSWRRSCRE